ncbi:site-specific integrase [Paracraurococcus ruber]|uniref:hypothetical protein n=1 Tax=Paracraurococcus ruber TaxID=77675 RepID=UPI0013054584|nr:hypothetical protein [Paracraurococcus ruber]
MSFSLTPGRLVWRLAEWPIIDQQLWQAGLAPRDQFDGPAYAEDRQPMTIRNAMRSHGRFMAVLAAQSLLDPTVPPAARVTPANARIFLTALQAKGNTNNSIVTRFFDLQAALKIMHPELDFSWLTSPGGNSLRSLLPATQRHIDPIDSADLLVWGHALMEDALRCKPATRRTRYRNGLLIALLAVLAPRLRSVAALRLERQVIAHGDGYRLIFTAVDVKNKRHIEYAVPDELVPHVEHYLTVERVELLGDRRHDGFWVNRNGEMLGARGIEGVIRRAARTRFGKAFGTHSFRHSLATTAARMDPSNPGLAAAILAISEAVVGTHYNRARQEEAAEAHVALVEQARQKTHLLARRRFRELGYR